MPTVKIKNDTCEERATSGPKISYSQALALYLVARSGAIVTVRTCTVKDMERLVTRALATLESPEACKRALDGLDYTQLLDRWFAIDTLRLHKAKAPLFGTEDEARNVVAQTEAIAKR